MSDFETPCRGCRQRADFGCVFLGLRAVEMRDFRAEASRCFLHSRFADRSAGGRCSFIFSGGLAFPGYSTYVCGGVWCGGGERAERGNLWQSGASIGPERASNVRHPPAHCSCCGHDIKNLVGLGSPRADLFRDLCKSPVWG